MAESLPELVRGLKEHYREHRGVGGCLRCELWREWNGPRGNIRELDALIERIEKQNPVDEDLLDRAREIRDWGEGNWTAKGRGMRARTKCSPGVVSKALQKGLIVEAAGIEPAKHSPGLMVHARLQEEGIDSAQIYP